MALRDPLKIDKELAKYKPSEMLGNGAFGVVYKGLYVKDGKTMPVAIKCITKKGYGKKENIEKEIEILKELASIKTLGSRYLVEFMEYSESSTHFYLVMEYCNCGDLHDYLQKKGPLDEKTTIGFLSQIAIGLRTMYNKKILHRDLKPSNILIYNPTTLSDPPVKSLFLKLADFGLSRFLPDGALASTFCGTKLYMAPEMFMSPEYDAKVDLWAVGVIGYELLVGSEKFEADYRKQPTTWRPAFPSDCSPKLKDLLTRLLTRNAKDRISSVEFFAHTVIVNGQLANMIYGGVVGAINLLFSSSRRTN